MPINKMTPETLAILSKYEDKFRRALKGENVALSSVGNKELSDAHYKVFGKRESMTPCCGGGRNTTARITPIAKAYFKQINGKETDTTGLIESLSKQQESETKTEYKSKTKNKDLGKE